MWYFDTDTHLHTQIQYSLGLACTKSPLPPACWHRRSAFGIPQRGRDGVGVGGWGGARSREFTIQTGDEGTSKGP